MDQEKLETTNISTRLAWGLTVQGFLFTALSLIIKKERDHAVSTLQRSIPIVGCASAIATLLGTAAALLTIGIHEERWRSCVDPHVHPMPFVEDRILGYFGATPGLFLPSLIAVVWLVVGLRIWRDRKDVVVRPNDE